MGPQDCRRGDASDHLPRIPAGTDGRRSAAAADYFYDEADASITTAFSTAAFRYGHSMQSPRIRWSTTRGGSRCDLLCAATENPALLTSDPAKVDLILKGLATQTAQENDAYIVNGLRNITSARPARAGQIWRPSTFSADEIMA